MTDEQIKQAKNAIGMYGNHQPYTRHGKRFYRPWRNRFCAPVGDPVWAGLEKAGLAGRYECGPQVEFFCVTRKGLDRLGEILEVHIYDEDN